MTRTRSSSRASAPTRTPVLIPDVQRETTGLAGYARALRLGASAAWRTPTVVDRSLAELLAPATVSPVRAHSHDVRRAAQLAHRVLGRLARLRPNRWRATCLHRSVAECLVLRALGHPARVVIGVGLDAGDVGVMAHAWVECPGIDCLATRGEAELERLASRRG